MTFKKIIAFGALILAAGGASAADHTVTIKGFAFEPSALTIAAGDTVTFINMDNAPHTATHGDGAFDTGRLSKNDAFSVEFLTAGEFAYFCAIHRSMTAQITVE